MTTFPSSHHRRRRGRPSEGKQHVTITLSSLVVEALLICTSNTSAFLEQQALKDERVAAYVAQQGVCKFPGCKQRITVINYAVYCALCPGWFCPKHYEVLHDEPDEEEEAAMSPALERRPCPHDLHSTVSSSDGRPVAQKEDTRQP